MDPEVEWPVTPEGRSLGFLGQFNLEELADALPESFPRSGLLSIFSVWAHHDPTESDYEWDEPYLGSSDAPAQILVTPLARLSRRSIPEDVKPYPCVQVSGVKVPDLGAITRKPPFDALGWNDPLRSALSASMKTSKRFLCIVTTETSTQCTVIIAWEAPAVISNSSQKS